MATTGATIRRCNPALVLALAAALVGAGCTAAPRNARAGAQATTPSTSTTSSTTTSTSTSTTTSTTSTTSTTTTTTTAPAVEAPPGLVDLVRARLADPRFGGSSVGLSVWVDGIGEIAAENADVPMRPGSNEKLLVAAGALATLGPDETFTTEVRTSGSQDGSVLRGDLVVVGGGDPTLHWHGPHSLDALAADVRRLGITEVAGDLVADESRYDSARTAPGWMPIAMPAFVGPVSALAVDGNLVRGDAEYLANPAVGNVTAFRQSLQRAGVAVTGTDRPGTTPPDSAVLASQASPPLGSIVSDMLTRSDNFLAEMLTKELGWRATGRGSTADGTAAAAEALRGIGVTLTGRSVDGSGLSRDNARPPREWRELLVAVRDQGWGGVINDGLPLAGRTGTLVNRMRGTPAEGVVRAKTGSVRDARALTGYLTTRAGRSVVFSLIVNGPSASSALGAMDDLVAALAGSTA